MQFIILATNIYKSDTAKKASICKHFWQATAEVRHKTNALYFHLVSIRSGYFKG